MYNFSIKLGLAKYFCPKIHFFGTICAADYTVVIYLLTKSVTIVMNPNNDIRFIAVNWQLNIERSKFCLCSLQIYANLFLHATVLLKTQNRPTQMP